MLKKYLASFETEEQYSEFLHSANYVTPNVSIINKTKKINNLKKNNKNGKNISNCSSEDLDEISLDIAPQIITDKMYINGDFKYKAISLYKRE